MALTWDGEILDRRSRARRERAKVRRVPSEGPPAFEVSGASGSPSVTSRMPMFRIGFAALRAFAYMHAPRMAGPVGVSPVGAMALSEAMSGPTWPGSSPISTLGVA